VCEEGINQQVIFIEESFTPGYSLVQASKKHLVKQSTLAGIVKAKLVLKMMISI